MVDENITPIEPEFELDDTPEMDIENNIANSATIDSIKRDIKEIKDKVNGIEFASMEDIINKVNTLQASIDLMTEDNDSQSFVINEIRDNLATLKDAFIKHQSAIKSLETKVIKDETYLSFDEWVKNVYLRNAGDPMNTFTRGDIYINCNKNIAAVNCAYINVRSINSDEPYSKEDRQAMYHAASSL